MVLRATNTSVEIRNSIFRNIQYADLGLFYLNNSLVTIERSLFLNISDGFLISPEIGVGTRVRRRARGLLSITIDQ